MNETLPAKDQSTRPRCEAAHKMKPNTHNLMKNNNPYVDTPRPQTPLPWVLCADPNGWTLHSNSADIMTEAFDCSDSDAAYIVKACNEYPKLMAQRDELRKALEWIADKLRAEGSADTQDAFQIIHHIESTTNG